MKKTILLLIAMFGLAGCPGNDKGSSNGTVGVNQLCANCGFNAAAFGQALTSQIPQASLTLSLAGDVNQINMLASMGQNPIFAYQGMMSVSGTMTVVSPLPLGYCYLPAGQYTVQTVQAGQYNMGVFSVPVVQFTGPVTLTAQLVDGEILNSGDILTGYAAYFVGLQGPAMMYNNGPASSYTSCMDNIGVQF